MQSNSRATIAMAVSTTKLFTVAEVENPTAILVHGAFAGGSARRKGIPQLREKRLKVVTVQNPLRLIGPRREVKCDSSGRLASAPARPA